MTPVLNLPSDHRNNDTLPPLPAELLLALSQRFERDELDEFAFRSLDDDIVSSSMRQQQDDDPYLERILNQLVPDETALSDECSVLPRLSLSIDSRIESLRAETDSLVRSIQLDDQDPLAMSSIQTHVGDLLTKVTSIRDAATESETVVRDITRDIQSLDVAKRNLVESMNALKRFQMLVNAFDQLTRLASGKKYRETSQALGAVKQLSVFFERFENVDRVAAVNRGVREVQNVLRSQVMNEFEQAFSNDAARVGKTKQLADACLVVDALGDDAKRDLLKWYALLMLRDYRRIFGSASEAGQLDNVSRRFAWFRRMMRTHEDDNADIFVPSWNVGAVLAGSFSEVTKDDLKAVLAKSAQSLTNDLLLEALAQVAEFEREAARKFSMSFESIVAMSAISFGRQSSTNVTIQSIFEPYLGVFVEAQARTIQEMMSGFTSSRISLSPADNPSSVLPSSTELFYYYRETLERCARLSVKQPLLDLCNVFKKWLKVYAEEVLAASLVKYQRVSGEGRPSVQELQRACLVLNTSEYCHETSSQLEERLVEKIHPDLKNRVSLENERQIFLSTVSASLLAILNELEQSVDPYFGAMARSPWRDAEFVSSESAYVGDIVRALQATVAVVREAVEHKKYIRTICDKIVGVVLAKFTQGIVRSRPISQTGAEQVLLDLQGLKACLLRLPLAPGDTTAVPMSYTRYVTKSVAKLDTLMKIVMTPDEPAEHFVRHYLVLNPCLSFSDFQKVLDLKGLGKKEQSTLMDLFLARTATATGLADSSFLTALDMEPKQQAGNSTYSSPSLQYNSGTGSGATGFAPTSQQQQQHPSAALNVFAGFGGTVGGSRDSSRVPTPLGGNRTGQQQQHDEKGGKEALQEFRRIGTRIGLATRLFGNH